VELGKRELGTVIWQRKEVAQVGRAISSLQLRQRVRKRLSRSVSLVWKWSGGQV